MLNTRILLLTALLAMLGMPGSVTAQKILIVVTNCATMGETGKETGYWMSEVSHAWVPFVDAGYTVDFASPEGGWAPIDPRSFDLEDKDNLRMWHDLDAVEALATTTPLAEVDPADYAAIYYAGGHGTMWDFPDSEAVQSVTSRIYEQGGIVAAVCHGPAALVNVKLTSGEYLVKDREVAAFTNSEEDKVGLTEAVPFLLETKLRERGAKPVLAPDYEKNVVVSGRLVTGQNPASASGAAEEVLKLLSEKDG